MPSYQKLQCRLSAPYILVACDGGLQRKKINTDDHLSMCSCSGGTELDKAVKFRISRSAWCTFSRGEQIRGYVHRENEHRGAHFRGWCTNSLAYLCAGARLRGGNEYAVTPAPVWRAVCVKIIALLMWIWIKFYPCPHRPDARRLCQNYSAIHVDMDKIGFIHIHTDEVRAVCVKIIAIPIWIWIKFYPCPHRQEARRSCQNSQKGAA